jgi:recombination protein RecA
MSVEQILKDIRKKYNDDSIFTLNDFAGSRPEPISTGFLDIDLKTGIGGIPRGRVTEIYGAESTGKSTIASSIVGNAQKAGLLCAYIDTEQCLDFDFSIKLGVHPDEMLLSQPNTLEEAFGITEALIRSGEVGLIVFDSLVGVGTEKEFEETEFGKANYGSAKLNTQWFRRNLPVINENNVAMVFTNQVRDKIGAYVPMLDTPGGHSIKFASSLMIQTSRVKDIKSGDDIIGIEFKANFKKNKLSAPFKIATFEIYFDRGIWKESDLFNVAVANGIIEQAGAYFRYEGETLAQGKANVLRALQDAPDLYDEIRAKTLTECGIVV